MAIRFGDAVKSFADGADWRRKRSQDSIDQALKQAQLQEAGFTYDGNTLTRDPGFMSAKALERKKLENENALSDFKLKRLSGFGGSASYPNGAQAFGGGNLVPKSYDEYGLPNSFYDPQAELAQKAQEEAQKPLSAEASGKLEGARQTFEQIQSVKALANKDNFEKRKQGVTKIRMGNKFGITDPSSIKGAIINAAGLGIPKKMVKTSDDDKKFELAVNLIAENNLRARTGAAAPTQEQIREEARQLVGDDTYESFLNRMGISEKYATGIAEGIRPGSSKKFGVQSMSTTAPPPSGGGYIDRAAALAAGATEEQIQAHARANGLEIR